MSRPKFPRGIVLPVSCIQRIRSEQDFYDRDPERYERMKRQREEDRREEQERENQEFNNDNW